MSQRVPITATPLNCSGPSCEASQKNMALMDGLLVQETVNGSIQPKGPNPIAKIEHFSSYINPSMLLVIGCLFIAYGLIAKK